MSPVSSEERQVGHDVRDGREDDGAWRACVGPSQAASSRGVPWPSSRLIASPATTGMSTSRPSAMISVAIETCWRSMPSDVHDPEGHGQRERDRRRHQQRRAPVPEPDERDDDHQHDRLVQAAMKQARQFSSTCRGWSEVRSMMRSGGSCGRTSASASSTACAELADLLARAHLHRERDGAVAVPPAGRRRARSGSSGSASGSRSRARWPPGRAGARARRSGRADHHVADLLCRLELARWRRCGRSCVSGLEDAAGSGHVAGAEHVLDLRDRQAQRREPVVRVVEVDLLREDAACARTFATRGTRCSVLWIRSVKSSSCR